MLGQGHFVVVVDNEKGSQDEEAGEEGEGRSVVVQGRERRGGDILGVEVSSLPHPPPPTNPEVVAGRRGREGAGIQVEEVDIEDEVHPSHLPEAKPIGSSLNKKVKILSNRFPARNFTNLVL